jgi:hypothetical protein
VTPGREGRLAGVARRGGAAWLFGGERARWDDGRAKAEDEPGRWSDAAALRAGGRAAGRRL